jgi:hypothetical protein
MTALAYPDVFHGALLNAGSDPIGGEAGIYLPPAELFHRFQQTRLVYVTGESDELNLRDDQISRGSMRDWCVLDIAYGGLAAPAILDLDARISTERR